MNALTLDRPATQLGTPPAAPTVLTHIVVVAHAPLASAFVKAAAEIAGDCNTVLALDYDNATGREATLDAALAGASGWAADAGVLVLTDLPGCTSPGIVAQQFAARLGKRSRLLGGMNMPMLLTALLDAGGELDQAWQSCRDTAVACVASPGAECETVETTPMLA